MPIVVGQSYHRLRLLEQLELQVPKLKKGLVRFFNGKPPYCSGIG